VDVQRQTADRLEQHADAGDAQDVADLVRVRDEGRAAVRHQQTGQLRRHQQGTLDVNVGVDQTRDHKAVGDVDPFAGRPVEGADAGDPAIGDDDVGRLDPLGEDVDDAAARQHQIARLLTQGDANPPLHLVQLSHRGSLRGRIATKRYKKTRKMRTGQDFLS
jgi:hypothetical protein